MRQKKRDIVRGKLDAKLKGNLALDECVAHIECLVESRDEAEGQVLLYAMIKRCTAALLSSASCRALAPSPRRYADLGGQLNKEYENYIRKERAQQRELEGSNKHNVQDQAKDGEALTSPESVESDKPLNPGGRQFGEPQPPEKVTDPKEHDLPLF